MTETTTPTGLHVMSVVDRMQTQASQYRYDSGFFTRDQCIAHTAEDREVRAAVAALIARNAEQEKLIADITNAAADAAIKHRDIAQALIAENKALESGLRSTEADRDRLAAENKALRDVRNAADKLPMCPYCDPDDWNDLSEALARTSAAAGDLGNG